MSLDVLWVNTGAGVKTEKILKIENSFFTQNREFVQKLLGKHDLNQQPIVIKHFSIKKHENLEKLSMICERKILINFSKTSDLC